MDIAKRYVKEKTRDYKNKNNPWRLWYGDSHLVDEHFHLMAIEFQHLETLRQVHARLHQDCEK